MAELAVRGDSAKECDVALIVAAQLLRGHSARSPLRIGDTIPRFASYWFSAGQFRFDDRE